MDKNLEIKSISIDKLLLEVKKNCTTKFDEAIDLSFQINNKQKKNEINLRTVINMPGGTGKTVKVAVVCEESKIKDANDALIQWGAGDLHIYVDEGQQEYPIEGLYRLSEIPEQMIHPRRRSPEGSHTVYIQHSSVFSIKCMKV